MNYLRDPQAIYRASFAAIRHEVALSRFPEGLHPLVLRLVHASAQPAIAADLSWSGDPVAAARAALDYGKPIFVDATMVASGIGRETRCLLNDPGAFEIAKRQQTTRSAAAVDLWRDDLAGAVVAIGNAPTALFRLIELIEDGAPKPAAIFAFPVGFVGAAESKEALIAADLDVPFLTLKGRLGGSALAAAAINAVARGTIE
jgi:precorrin-8X/cobalt-precorrin-8 methylmutase